MKYQLLLLLLVTHSPFRFCEIFSHFFLFLGTEFSESLVAQVKLYIDEIRVSKYMIGFAFLKM